MSQASKSTGKDAAMQTDRVCHECPKPATVVVNGRAYCDDHRFEGKQMNEAQRLSKMLFDAREQVEMWADVVEARSGQPAEQARRLVAEIDAYRAEKGWSPHGFGGET